MNDLLILGTLLDSPKHGYAVKKLAGLMTGRASMHNNLVYPLLKTFVEKGWLTQRESAGERGQRRQVYSITPGGRRALAESLSEFGANEVRSGEAFRLRVGFFDLLKPAARREILGKRKSYLEAEDAKLARLEGGMHVGRWGEEAVRFIRQQARSELGWVRHLEKLAGRGGRRRR